MKIAITGGTGFVGAHLAVSLVSHGHEVILISRGINTLNEHLRDLPRTTFSNTGTGDEEQLVEVFQQCDAVAHCAGINREIKPGDYDCAHVLGTRNVVNAAQRAGVKKLALISFYRARPNCGSLYHESKFASEEIVRGSELDYTVIKAGMIYGKGDHMLDHLSHVFHTVPVFALVGMKDRTVAPLSIEDLVKIAEASLVEGRMSRQTVAAVGPEKMSLGQMIRRVGNVVGKTPLTFPFPVAFHENFAKLLEATMKVPLISSAQVRILTEGFDEPSGVCDPCQKI